MACPFKENQFRTWNAFGKNPAVLRRDEAVAFAMKHECWSCDLRQAAVTFPSQDGLQLGQVSLSPWKPGTANSDVLIDKMTRRSRGVNKRNRGLCRLLRGHCAGFLQH